MYSVLVSCGTSILFVKLSGLLILLAFGHAGGVLWSAAPAGSWVAPCSKSNFSWLTAHSALPFRSALTQEFHFTSPLPQMG